MLMIPFALELRLWTCVQQVVTVPLGLMIQRQCQAVRLAITALRGHPIKFRALQAMHALAAPPTLQWSSALKDIIVSRVLHR
jgi:hypothetical protein